MKRPDRAPTLTGRQPLEPDSTPVRPGRISAERGKRLSGRRRCIVFFFVAAASVPVLEIDPKVLDRLAAELNSHISERISPTADRSADTHREIVPDTQTAQTSVRRRHDDDDDDDDEDNVAAVGEPCSLQS